MRKQLVGKVCCLQTERTKRCLSIRSTIHLYHVSKKDFLSNEAWLKHELCHVQQFKRYGFVNFLLKYIWESFKKGYFNNKYEVQAREAEKL
ncbi:MAG: hypothetical protein WEA59_09630 [Ferruginibacter sp.]